MPFRREGYAVLWLAVPFAVTGLLLSAAPPTTAAVDFTNVTYHRCYDGDTCTFTIPGIHPLFGEKISVRIAGIDTPEIRGKCPEEKALAKTAKRAAIAMLKGAKRIDLLRPERGKYFRIVADIMADGTDVGAALIRQGLAVPYDGGTKTHAWCRSK